jgi:ribosomal RNA-processing protein 9
MPDSFFASNKPRKRKRDGEPSTSSRKYPRASKKVISNGKSTNTPVARTASKGGSSSSYRAASSKKNVDEELESDVSDAEGGGIDEMDLRAASEPEGSGDEIEDETPAEKRLRLAKLYLESVKEDLGTSHNINYFPLWSECFA